MKGNDDEPAQFDGEGGKGNMVHLHNSLASPETIRSSSNGEVNHGEIINFMTQRPQENGLFCEKIFGPINISKRRDIG